MAPPASSKRKRSSIELPRGSNKKRRVRIYHKVRSTNTYHIVPASESHKNSSFKSFHKDARLPHEDVPSSELLAESGGYSDSYRPLIIRHRSLSIDSMPETLRRRSMSVDSVRESITSSSRDSSPHTASDWTLLSRSCSRMTSRMDAVVISPVCSLPEPIYRPFRNEVAETPGLRVPGESDIPNKSRPVRNLNDFTLYGHDGKYLPFALVAWSLEKGTGRTILASGIVTRRLEDPDDGDSDMESVDTELRVSLQPLVDFWVDYDPCQPSAVWIGTQDAWYILQEPDALYAVLYQPFWIAHRLAWHMAKATREGRGISLEDFLKKLPDPEDEEAISIVGRELNAKDLEKDYTIAYILDQLSSPSLSDSKKFFQTRLLKDLSCRAAERNVSMEGLFDVIQAEPDTEPPNPAPASMQTVTMPLVHELTTGIFLTSLLKAGKELDVEERRNKLLRSPEPPDILHPDSPTNIEWEEPLEGYAGYYGQVCLDGETYCIGDVVMVNPGEDDVAHRAKSAVEACSQSQNTLVSKVWFCKIIYMYDKYPLESNCSIDRLAHVQWYQDGAKTILQETAHPYGLFALAECADIHVETILGRCAVRHLKPGDRESNSYHCRFLWDADNCRFLDQTVLTSQAGTRDGIHPQCTCCTFNQKRERDATSETFIYSDRHATVRGIDYHKNDFVYIAAMQNSPYFIGQIRQFIIDKDFILENTKVELTRLGRYDDVARAMEETRGLSLIKKDELRLFMTEQVESYALPLLEGKCFVNTSENTTPSAIGQTADHFYVDRWAKKVSARTFNDLMPFPPRELAVCNTCVDSAREDQRNLQDYMERKPPLRAMELFAGAGGLSTGLEQSGFVTTRWAIEMSSAAAATFEANHPNAWVYSQDTNVCLQSAIDVREGKPYSPLFSLGDGKELPPMPQRGDVDLIAGGFPCQSFSGMNHQRHKRPHDIRTTLVANMLSYVEFYQPQYVLMENVKGILEHHIKGGLSETKEDDEMNGETVVKMGIVKFVLRALTCLGYQAQLKVLQAVEYGSPQSRERVIFWGARHPHILPDYPLPTHVSTGCRTFTLNLPTHDKLIPSRRSENGCAPFRALVVADAISDLPGFEWKNPQKENDKYADEQRMDRWTEFSAVSNIAGPLTGFLEPVDYATLPNTRYQRMMRGNQTQVTLHCSRTFRATVVERVWHVCSDNVYGPEDIPRSVWTRTMKESSASELEKIWRRHFGRLQWKKPFSTALTSCSPFSKGSKNLHPKQKRIITARECARSQGFPDYYEFVQSEEDAKPEAWAKLLDDIHKQIGNAVPVPLARALGDSLGVALLKKWLEGTSG